MPFRYVVSLLILLAGTSLASAQGRGHGHGGMRGGIGPYFIPSYYPNAFQRGYSGLLGYGYGSYPGYGYGYGCGMFPGYYGVGLGLGGLGLGGYGVALGYGGYGAYGAYPGIDPYLLQQQIIQQQNGVGQNPYPQPIVNLPPGEHMPSPRTDVAELVVNVPDDAEVWIEGVKMKQTGTRRRFTSPTLMPGVSYAYEVRATWTQNGRQVSDSNQVTLHAGDRASLTFINRPRRLDNAFSKAEK